MKRHSPELELATYRRRHGLTQSELASQVGIRRETLSRIENGRQFFTEVLQRRIVRALGLSDEEVNRAFGFPTRGAESVEPVVGAPVLRVVATAPRERAEQQ